MSDDDEKQKKQHEDESSEDEDYVPEADVEGQIEDQLDEKEDAEYARQMQAKKGTLQAKAPKRKVDDMWSDLNADTAVSQKSTDKSQKLLNKLLSGVAGKKKKQMVHEFKIPVLGCSTTTKRATELKMPDETVTEVLKYAGQEYSVTKKATAPKASALDSALAALNQPKKISTIEKSSVDWDTFKDKEGISDELQQYTKDGYLEKQDFLHRVDVRKFELEKAERDKLRRANP
ncbi:Aste57867_1012 [Aphanomyces stellatus]|uniref:Aste57867_1012 protein n=1 Tax=Aphanomyces stellatus TaxID=120398 RepID=A0A485K980_9STRA|nr:hypothetical protein As57867_001011 [Aphanomyces stellatus]VFT78234.1 Aste57867_1012 [Aphanomyces stellatus]